MVVGIIGAGASGMAAALAAVENENVQVELFERQARVGRKLQATGNGRCNLTNLHASIGHYHGEDSAFAAFALESMDPEATIRWFQDLGLFTVAEDSGKVYPYSDQANSVVDVLRYAIDQERIQLHLGCEVQKIHREDGGFTIECSDGLTRCDKLIVACGGLAGTKLGGSMSGYKILSKLGHKTSRLRPSLVQLRCAWGGKVALKGVRANCHVRILKNNALFAESCGELQFTDYGLSGPVIFEVSRDACYGGGSWIARLDFLPAYSENELIAELERRRARNISMEELLVGMTHNRLGRVLVKTAGIAGSMRSVDLKDAEILEIVRALKAFEIVLTEPMGMDCAQVTAGGVLTGDFDPTTMESKLVPGLYACGEVLDIDGDCGGFNLQWAWSSGYLAGKCAGKEYK